MKRLRILKAAALCLLSALIFMSAFPAALPVFAYEGGGDDGDGEDTEVVYVISETEKTIYKFEFFRLCVETQCIGGVNDEEVKFIWRSDDSDVATVDRNGMVKGIDRGETTIYAKLQDGTVVGECKVEVKYTAWQWILKYILFGWLIGY